MYLSEQIAGLSSHWPFQQRYLAYIVAKVKQPDTPQAARNAVFYGAAVQLAVSNAIVTDDSVRSVMITADPWTPEAANQIVDELTLQASINNVWPVLLSVWAPEPPPAP